MTSPGDERIADSASSVREDCENILVNVSVAASPAAIHHNKQNDRNRNRENDDSCYEDETVILSEKNGKEIQDFRNEDSRNMMNDEICTSKTMKSHDDKVDAKVQNTDFEKKTNQEQQLQMLDDKKDETVVLLDANTFTSGAKNTHSQDAIPNESGTGKRFDNEITLECPEPGKTSSLVSHVGRPVVEVLVSTTETPELTTSDLASAAISVENGGTTTGSGIVIDSNGCIEFVVDEKTLQSILVICPLCKGLFREPITLCVCRHTFCKSCYITAFEQCDCYDCPVCFTYIGRDNLYKAGVFAYDRTLEHLIDNVLFPEIAVADHIAEIDYYTKERNILPKAQFTQDLLQKLSSKLIPPSLPSLKLAAKSRRKKLKKLIRTRSNNMNISRNGNTRSEFEYTSGNDDDTSTGSSSSSSSGSSSSSSSNSSSRSDDDDSKIICSSHGTAATSRHSTDSDDQNHDNQGTFSRNVAHEHSDTDSSSSSAFPTIHKKQKTTSLAPPFSSSLHRNMSTSNGNALTTATTIYSQNADKRYSTNRIEDEQIAFRFIPHPFESITMSDNTSIVVDTNNDKTPVKVTTTTMTLPPLDLEYMKIQGRIRIGQLKRYLCQQLKGRIVLQTAAADTTNGARPTILTKIDGKLTKQQQSQSSSLKESHFEIWCNSTPLGNEWSLAFVLRTIWTDPSVLLTLTYGGCTTASDE